MDNFKTVRPWLLRAAALLGVLIALTIVINLPLFDEDLHPELKRLLDNEPIALAGNAYPDIYGFLAASGRDARAAGIEIVHGLEQRHDAGEPVTLSDAELGAILGGPDSDDDSSSLFPAIACNSRFELDCADRLIAEVRAASAVPPRLAVLLARYEAILDAPRFEEMTELDVDSPLPALGPLLRISRIRLALGYLHGSTQTLLADAAKDIAFWKRMLRDGESLIAKMVALAGLRNDAEFLSTLMRERSLGASELALLTSMLTPLSADERDIGETFLAELRMMLQSSKPFAVLVEGPPVITRLALQRQATLNEIYLTAITPLRLRAGMSAHEFYRERANEPLSYEMRAVPPPLYNLGGKLVLEWFANTLGWTDYITRVHDLDGRIALVLLQAEIEAEPGRNIADIVRASTYRNPYTLEPMDYDASQRTLGFDCLAVGDDVCSIRI